MRTTPYGVILLLWGAGLGAAAQYGKVSVIFDQLPLAYPEAGAAVGWIVSLVGFVGILIILQPGFAVFSPYALFPLCSALLFALYGLLTRYAARRDRAATSFFWTGVSGAVVMTAVGLWYWQPMAPADWVWMAILCLTGAGGHYLLIKTYEVAEASAVQPFAYFQLVFGAAIGVTLFGEVIRTNVAIGAAIIVAAGLFTFWREAQQRSAR